MLPERLQVVRVDLGDEVERITWSSNMGVEHRVLLQELASRQRLDE
jgi:hypothetical protein